MYGGSYMWGPRKLKHGRDTIFNLPPDYPETRSSSHDAKYRYHKRKMKRENSTPYNPKYVYYMRKRRFKQNRIIEDDDNDIDSYMKGG
jgi:hypothetical protein